MGDEFTREEIEEGMAPMYAELEKTGAVDVIVFVGIEAEGITWVLCNGVVVDTVTDKEIYFDYDADALVWLDGMLIEDPHVVVKVPPRAREAVWAATEGRRCKEVAWTIQT